MSSDKTQLISLNREKDRLKDQKTTACFSMQDFRRRAIPKNCFW